MKRIFIIISILASGMLVSAQIASDALLIGQQFNGGTARYMAMGGAFNALGGDFSTLSVNPAGIGIYRSNEFTMTADLRFNSTTSTVNDASLSPFITSYEDSKSNFNLQNIGYVTHSKLNNTGLLSLNFGFGYNRLKNYHRKYSAEVKNSAHSLTDTWANDLFNYGVNDATSGAFMADQAYLLNTVREYGADYSDTEIIKAESPLLPDATSDFYKEVEEEGRINEWVFSLGGNYDDVVYFGATFGIQDIKFKKEYFISENFNAISDTEPDSYQRWRNNDADDIAIYPSSGDDYFNYYTEERTDGIGFNGKFGVIVRPANTVRLGLAVHTPTINYLSVMHYGDIYNHTAYYDDNNYEIDPVLGGTPGEGSESKSYDYRTVSPYKVHASVAFIIGSHLAIDIEGDMIDYSTMKIKDDFGSSSTFREVNNSIDDMYKTAFNARFGFEYKPLPIVALRGGVSYYGSPYESNISEINGYNATADYVGDTWSYSGGIGFRTGDVFVDLTYLHIVQEGSTMVFNDAIDNYETYEMGLDQTINRFMMTFGVKF